MSGDFSNAPQPDAIASGSEQCVSSEANNRMVHINSVEIILGEACRKGQNVKKFVTDEGTQALCRSERYIF